MEIVVNRCYGGYGLSDKAAKMMGYEDTFEAEEVKRDDPTLVATVRYLGSDKASGGYSELQIVKIPDEATDWMVDEYDGFETVFYVVNGKIHTK